MIDLKQLKALVKLMVTSDLTEIDLQDAEGERVKVKRGSGEPTVHYAPAAAPAPAPAAPAASPAPAPAAGGEAPLADSGADEGLAEITSPMVGTFYSAASPDADPFVSAGATVGNDTVVCIVEAMKVFNEIKAELAGTVQKILVKNEDPVEFGQPLFQVKPD